MYNETEVINRIIEAIKASGQTQKDVLLATGINTSFLTDWKKGRVKSPGIEKIQLIAEYLNLSLDYIVSGTNYLFDEKNSDDEQQLLKFFRRLDDHGKKIALLDLYRITLEREVDTKDLSWVQNLSSLNYVEDFDTPQNTRDIALYNLSASAGNGQFLDSDTYEVITVPFNEVSQKATFAVKISGDSMEPDYKSGDILYVRQQLTLNNGDLGIFIMNGEGYFKRYLMKGHKPYLESINKDYSVMALEDHSECRIVGKVLGKFEEEHPP